jgi:hypothetical protein
MLKITYTDTEPHLEYLAQAIEEWIAHHTILAVRTGQPLIIEPGRASLLLPIDWGERVRVSLAEVTRSPMIQSAIAEPSSAIDLCRCDDRSLELSLTGLWVAANPETHTGHFITMLSPSVERNVFNLWLSAHLGGARTAQM